MKQNNDIKEYLEKVWKVLFGSFAVYIGVAIIAEVVFLFVLDENKIEFIFSPLFMIPVVVISYPVLWKYMK